MANLFSGVPQSNPTSSSSTSQSPGWLQDAIYNQIQAAQNVAAMPYQQYKGDLVAGNTPYQQAAWDKLASTQGAWQNDFNNAASNLTSIQNRSGGAEAAQPLIGAQQGALGQINYDNPFAQANPFINQAVSSGGGLKTAQPWLQQSAGSSAGRIDEFMNPYIGGVTDEIARLGARNLNDVLLPGVSDAFVKAGGFGGTRMGEFGSRALRDTQEAILGEQSRALQAGYTTALQAAQGEQGRLMNIGNIFGDLGTAQQGALMTAGRTLGDLSQNANEARLAGASQYGDMARTLGGLTQGDTQNMINAASQQSDLAKQQQQMRLADIAALESAGTQQQQQRQNELNAQYQQWQQMNQYPKGQLDWLQSQLMGTGNLVPATTYGTGDTTSYGASPLGQIAGLGSALAGFFS